MFRSLSPQIQSPYISAPFSEQLCQSDRIQRGEQFAFPAARRSSIKFVHVEHTDVVQESVHILSYWGTFTVLQCFGKIVLS